MGHCTGEAVIGDWMNTVDPSRFSREVKGPIASYRVGIVTLFIYGARNARARLIRTRLIRSFTSFEVSVKSLKDSYHFMFKIYG